MKPEGVAKSLQSIPYHINDFLQPNCCHTVGFRLDLKTELCYFISLAW